MAKFSVKSRVWRSETVLSSVTLSRHILVGFLLLYNRNYYTDKKPTKQYSAACLHCHLPEDGAEALTAELVFDARLTVFVACVFPGACLPLTVLADDFLSVSLRCRSAATWRCCLVTSSSGSSSSSTNKSKRLFVVTLKPAIVAQRLQVELPLEICCNKSGVHFSLCFCAYSVINETNI